MRKVLADHPDYERYMTTYGIYSDEIYERITNLRDSGHLDSHYRRTDYSDTLLNIYLHR